MTDKSIEEIADKAVRLAQQEGKKKGFKPDDWVAHPSEEKLGRFVRTKGRNVIVVFRKDPQDKSTEYTRTFPTGEIFDPETARKLGEDLVLKRFREQMTKVRGN
jgi:hypothetical protein